MNKISEIVDEIKKFNDSNNLFKLELNSLIKVISQISSDNVNNNSFIKTKDDELKIKIIHKNDNFRIIEIIILQDFIKISTCFMFDSFIYQLRGRKLNIVQLEEFYLKYFFSIFGDTFYKEIYYKKAKVIEYRLIFDDSDFRNRAYSTFKNKIFKVLFGFNPSNIEKFRYLSFFKKYDYNIKNIYL